MTVHTHTCPKCHYKYACFCTDPTITVRVCNRCTK